MNNPTLPLIYDFSLDELVQTISKMGEPAYRARQLWQGIYQNLWSIPNEFTTIPQHLLRKLAGDFNFQSLVPSTQLVSRDGQTVKILFSLPNDASIEAVLMRYDRRQTLCISTQAGCPMKCAFCATGAMGFKRNLSSGEIVEQVLHYARLLKSENKEVTNVVIMGMGEPFLNYDATLVAVDRLNNPQGMNLGARRFTISTVGIIPGIQRFTAENRQVNLAISLHAANDDLRSTLLPVNKKYPLSQLIPACREYGRQTNRRITFEWALIQGVNDSINDARQLAQLVTGILCHINIIPLNPTKTFNGVGSSRDTALAFSRELARHNIPCTIRLRRGIDIQAGCGQLAIQTNQPPVL